MRELTSEEVQRVSGGNWFLRELSRSIIIEGVMWGGRGMWEYAQTAPPQAFERERAAL